MGAQCFNGAVVTCQLCFREARMDFIVTNLVKQHGWAMFAPFELRDKMMQRLACMRWDRPKAQWTDWIGHRYQAGAMTSQIQQICFRGPLQTVA